MMAIQTLRRYSLDRSIIQVILLVLACTFIVGCTTIHTAAQFGDVDYVRAALEKDQNAANVKEKHGSTPLHYAAGADEVEVAELLIAKGADLDARNFSGLTPLHMSASHHSKNTTELLLSKGADHSIHDRYGNTPLIYAASPKANVRLGGTGPQTELVKLLLVHGADINAKNNVGMTALHAAAWKGCEGVVKLLVQRGADTTLKNKYGQTPLDLAEKYGQEAIADFLRAYEQ